MNDSDIRTSTARVSTGKPTRYGKQLASHMGRRIPAVWDEGSCLGELRFTRDGIESGTCALSCEEDALILELRAPSDEELERIEAVVGVHLARFGAKDSLSVAWVRADGAKGPTLGPFSPEEVAEHNRLRRESRAARHHDDEG